MSSIPLTNPPPAQAAERPSIGARSGSGAAPRRITGALAALVALAVLVVASRLEPSPAGLGTHRQIVGMVPCPWITYMDCPCPTCGMTTAFAHAAHGHVLRSIHAQPMGGLLAIAAAMTVLLGAHTAVTGSRAGSMLLRFWRPWSAWALAGLLVVAWMYKIASYKGWLP